MARRQGGQDSRELVSLGFDYGDRWVLTCLHEFLSQGTIMPGPLWDREHSTNLIKKSIQFHLNIYKNNPNK